VRILFLSDNFPPEGNAPATRLHEHALRWVRAGHDVTVVTCAPNFPEGRLFPGYANRWRQVEHVDGIRVVRVKTYITANEGVAKRTLDYLSFMVAGGIAALFERPRPDVVVATSPQFFCAVAGWAVAALRRLPFVFELRDLWPASIQAVGAMRPSFALRQLERVERFLYRRADAIVPVTRAFRDDLVARGIDAGKIHVVRNGVDLERYAPAAPDPALAVEWGLSGKFVVGYLGTHGMAHALQHVVDAAARLRHRDDIVFLFAGGGAARAAVEAQVAAAGLDNVRLLPRQPKAAMPALWAQCSIALIPLRDDPVFATVLPSKLFEAMGMGVPVLMSLPAGEATGIVEATGCGLCVPPEDPAALATAIEGLADAPGSRDGLAAAAAAAAPDYSRDALARAMLDVLVRTAEGHALRRR
jgi:colanic acid biosynthesis glycosyl transferase WcaI